MALSVNQGDLTMTYSTAVVSQVIEVGFADLAQAADELPGQEFTTARAQLKVHDRVGTGLAGAIRFGGTLRTSPLLPALKVEVVVSPWSADRSEVAIQPVSRLGRFDSIRARRFFQAAGAIVPPVVDHLVAEVPVEVPAALQLAA
jgi:hypothetical protein